MQATNITTLYSHSRPEAAEPGPDGLPWHWGARPNPPARRTPIAVDGIQGRLALEHGGLLRRDALLVDGRPAPRVDRSHAYWLRREDGGWVQARLRPSFTRALPDVEVDGRVVRLGEPLPGYLLVLVFLPLVLGLAFGAPGAAIGGLGALFNRSLARQPWSKGLEAVAMLSTFVGAAALTMVVVVASRLLALAGG